MTAPLPPPADAAAAERFTADFYTRAPAAPAELRPLLACLGGNSPFLADLALREPENLLAIAANGPNAVCDLALVTLAAMTPAQPRSAIAAGLRTARRAVALAAAVADISGAWSLAEVTGALSNLADGALRLSVAHLMRQAHASGRIALPHPAAPDRDCGFTVLAMGKLGARELNFSSDVDLILLYDPAINAGRDDIGQTMTRLAHDLVGLMATHDAGGYVFRVDLRLRPDPASTPPAIALPAALSYYESLGQTWERAALIKARPVAGDISLGHRFLREVQPFVWRRHLDFAAIADIRAMKLRMDAHRATRLGREGPAAVRVLGHDVKLGEGGIREIEFCAQTLQLVWGGRSPALRVPATLDALDAEVASRHLPAATVTALKAAYVFLRTAEHRLQMVADRQTHTLPATLPALENFARFLGFPGAAALADSALRHMEGVHAVFAGMFADLPPAPDEAPPAAPVAAATLAPVAAATLAPVAAATLAPVAAATLAPVAKATGAPFADATDVQAAFGASWLAGRPRAFRTERAKLLLHELLPALQAAIARQPDPAVALVRLDDFFHRLPAGVQVLSMLRHNPALLARLADVLGAAPWLADHLADVPAALDGLAAPDEAPRDPGALLAAQVHDARGLDDTLSIASRTVRAEEFSIAVNEFFGRIDADDAGRRRTSLADAVIGICLEQALADHAHRYGRVPDGGLAVVALGKAGSGEMMAGSDLDLMLIYDHPADAESRGGNRTLPASQFYARAAHAVIAALTVPTKHGPLYEVDMRLRPSGTKGPVAVSLSGFIHYHRTSAWTWERLALTRARVVAGPAKLRRRVTAAMTAALRGADPARVRPDTVEMRARLLRDLPPQGFWDARLRPGGLMEVEFVAQALLLLNAARPRVLAPRTSDAFANLARIGALPPDDAALLTEADRFWRTLQGLMRIALGRLVPRDLPPPLLEKLLRATGVAPDEAALRNRVERLSQEVRAAFVRHVGGFDAS
jgi:glutamate-ammonia-ligase adenylyltransferase